MQSHNCVITQVFNHKWKVVEKKLEEFRDRGITHIQLPPVQEHCTHIYPWFRVYQPTGHTKPGNSYGSEKKLKQLINAAHAIGIKIIVDVVLHHTCACPICNRVSKMAGLSWMSSMIQREFKAMVLGHPRIYERFNMIDWGPRQDVEREAVMKNHIELLQNLIDIGVDGFRFDAAKHIPVNYFEKVLKELKTKDELLMYTESLDGSPEVCLEYTNINGMRALDFPLTFTLIHATSINGDIRDMLKIPTNPLNKVVSLADCHDSLVGDSYHFGDFTDSVIAACFILGRDPQGSIPLIFHTLLDIKQVQAGIQFYHAMKNQPQFIRSQDCSPTQLVISRGDCGLMIINKSSEWSGSDTFEMCGMKSGVWKELVYGFEVIVENGWVKEWGKGSGRGGYNIGPRDVLYLIAT